MYTTQIIVLSLLFCAALIALIVTLCRIGEKNRKTELDVLKGF